MPPTPVNLEEKLSRFADLWSPKIVAESDDFHFKLAKLKGDFVWHKHDETDEVFLVVVGELRIDFRDGAVVLEAGEMLVVPRGVEHKPYAEEECSVLLFSRKGTVNTGDAPADGRTADPNQWI